MSNQDFDEVMFDPTLWSSGGSSLMRVSPEGVEIKLSPEFFNTRLTWGTDKVKREQWRHNLEQITENIEELGKKWGLL
jgi:hypothetical protein